MLLGILSAPRTSISATGLSPAMARLPRRFAYTLLSRRLLGRTARKVPQPRTRNSRRISHVHGLASSDFARHYSRNHGCFLFLWVLRCFTSPRSLYPPYTFRRESPGRHAAWRGFPIRTPSDQNLLISSPRLIADCYVLLRLQMPRHPPFALKDLKSHEQTNPKKGVGQIISLRCSRPLCSSQSTGGTRPHHQPVTGTSPRGNHQPPRKAATASPSGPNNVQTPRSPTPTFQPSENGVLARISCADAMSNVPPMS